MYAKGMTTRQFSETIEDIYGFEVSEGMVSDITDKLLPKIEEWQNRPLLPVYPIVYWWYEKALRGKYADIMGDKLLWCLCEEIAEEFPSVDTVPDILKNRHYEKISDPFWR